MAVPMKTPKSLPPATDRPAPNMVKHPSAKRACRVWATRVATADRRRSERSPTSGRSKEARTRGATLSPTTSTARKASGPPLWNHGAVEPGCDPPAPTMSSLLIVTAVRVVNASGRPQGRGRPQKIRSGGSLPDPAGLAELAEIPPGPPEVQKIGPQGKRFRKIPLARARGRFSTTPPAIGGSSPGAPAPPRVSRLTPAR